MKSPIQKKKMPVRKNQLKKMPTKKSWEAPKSDAWVDPIHTSEQKVADYIGGFLIMFEASLRPESNFDSVDILRNWWHKAGLPSIEGKIGPFHSFLIIYTKLFYNACKEYDVKIQSDFMKEYDVIQSKRFLTFSNNRATILIKRLGSIIYSHFK